MHTNKQIDNFFMRYEKILDFQGKVTDEIFEFLIKNISKKDKEDVPYLIYLVNKKEHIDKLVSEYNLNLKKVHLLDKIWIVDYTEEHLESLKTYDCVSLKKIFTNIISKENKRISNRRNIENKNSEILDFVIKNVKMDSENIGLINPIHYLEIIKSNRDDFKNFIIYFSRSNLENSFSEDIYDKEVFIDYFDIIGKEKFLELYNNERYFKAENIIMLIENNRLKISDFNYLRSESLNGKIEIKEDSFYPAYYELFNGLNNDVVVNKQMKFNENIDISLLDKNIYILFKILRNKKYDEISNFIKVLHNTSNEKFNILIKDKNLFSLFTSNLSNYLSFNFKKQSMENRLNELSYIKDLFHDILELYFKENKDVIIENKNNKNFIDDINNYDLLEIILDSNIMVCSDYNKLKVSLWNKINTEDDLGYLFLKDKFIKKEKELILNNLDPIEEEKNSLRKRI